MATEPNGRDQQHLSAAQFIDAVLDADSFTSWDKPITELDTDPAYLANLEKARDRSGVDESILSGEGLIQGRRVAVVVSEFAFLAGSIGRAAADRIVGAIERATREDLPLLAAPASGGTRMQEGTLAFLAMVRITAAVRAHRQAKLPYLVYLRHPTTGGVMASWGSLGHVAIAEPGALLGFLGPRVYEALHGQAFPPHVQVAENLFDKGILDAVVPPEQLSELVDRALSVLVQGPTEPVGPPATLEVRPSPVTAWTSIEISRNPSRPNLRQLLSYGATEVLPLNGPRNTEHAPGLLLVAARFGRQPCIVIGHNRPTHADEVEMGPESLRQGRRGMHMAEELGLPLLTVIDTAGATLSQEAEEGGLAGEIARSLHDLIGLRSPTVSVLLGQGAGGAALALLPADRTIAAHHAWLSPLPPEGASVIMHRSTDFAPEMAAAQGVNVASLYTNGIVDHIVDERFDAAEESKAFCTRLASAIEYEISSLLDAPIDSLLATRVAKYRKWGQRADRHVPGLRRLG